MIVAGTALALGSFKSDDPWVVIPMLAISGFAFVCLCIWHEGSRLARAGVALLLVVLLTFIGWRDLRKPVSLAVATTLPPQALPLVASKAPQPMGQKPIKSPNKKPAVRQPQISTAQPSTTTSAASQPQQQIISAPNGIAIGGGTVTNPVVNNFSPPERVLQDAQINILSRLAGPQPSASPFHILYQAGDDEAFRFARSIAASLAKAGWQIGPPMTMIQGGLNHGIWICGGKKEDQERLRDALVGAGYGDLVLQDYPTREMSMLVGANKK